MRSYKNLSDHDFELLIADLLHAEHGRRYEIFARGADGGVDLRHEAASGEVDVIQCKHMAGSTFSQLNSSARSEAIKVGKMEPAPSRYRLFTTRPITSENKSTLKETLTPWIRNQSDIVGPDELEGWLNDFPDVEKAHIKLWLTSAAQLDRLHGSAIWARSERMMVELREALPRYVETGVFNEAKKQLRKNRVIVLSGPPGIGKTTIAQVLVADAVADGYEPIEVSGDIDEGNSLVDPEKKRIFYYDDFLGSTFLQERLSKNEDKRLSSFIRRCTSSENNLLVMTTREHILQQATSWYEQLEKSGIPLLKLLLELKRYSRYERGAILYHHVVNSSSLDTEDLRDLLINENYLSIIDHPNYNPRSVEYLASAVRARDSSDTNRPFSELAKEVLDDPDIIWNKAFSVQLDEDSKDLVIAVASMDGAVLESAVSATFEHLVKIRGRSLQRGAYLSSLRVLDDSFLRTSVFAGQTMVEVGNPSISDFVASWLRRNFSEALSSVNAVLYFDQIDWLAKEVVQSYTGSERTQLENGLAEAIKRTFNTPSIRFWRSKDPTSRLIFLNKLEVSLSISRALLADWMSDRVLEISDSWEKTSFPNISNIAALVKSLSSDRRLDQRVLDHALQAALRANSKNDWEAAFAFVIGFETPEGYAEELSDAFSDWLRERLVAGIDEIEDGAELEDLEYFADLHGNYVDQEIWIAAHEEVNSRIFDEVEPDESRPSHPTVANFMTESEQAARLRAMFVQLQPE